MRGPKRTARKLLIASVGIAAVAYTACGDHSVGNLMAVEAGPQPDAGTEAGKDAAPDAPSNDAATQDASDAGSD